MQRMDEIAENLRRELAASGIPPEDTFARLVSTVADEADRVGQAEENPLRRAAAIMLAIYGDKALEKARMIEEASPAPHLATAIRKEIETLLRLN